MADAASTVHAANGIPVRWGLRLQTGNKTSKQILIR
jgi:hypothetical protein